MTKQETAAWMGYVGPAAVAQMDGEHDDLHAALCAWIGTASYSLREAEGEKLNPDEQYIAWVEEDAVLHLQRLRQNLRVRAGIEPNPITKT